MQEPKTFRTFFRHELISLPQFGLLSDEKQLKASKITFSQEAASLWKESCTLIRGALVNNEEAVLSSESYTSNRKLWVASS